MDSAAYDIYNDQYYETNDTGFRGAVVRDYGPLSSLLRTAFVLLLRAGFVLIQIGCIPVTNVHLIIIQNIVDIACVTFTYGTLGYMFAFGHDKKQIIGLGGWLTDRDADLDNALLGWCAIITATGIYTTMVAGRLHAVAYILISSLIGVVIMPMAIHWVWAKGWMQESSFIGHTVSFKDQGGSILIHATGGIVALIAGLFLGRRLMRLKEIDELSLPPNSPGSTFLGYFLVIIGIIGICLPTPIYEATHLPENYIGLIVINSILAAGGGILIVVILQFVMSRDLVDYWLVLRCIQGGVAGIVTVSAGVDVYKPLVAMALGIGGGALYHFTTHFMFYSSLEDYCNIIPIHLMCGFIGSLLPSLCSTEEGFGVPSSMWIHFLWQVICALVIIAYIGLLVMLLFFLPVLCGLLRNTSEMHNFWRARNVSRRGPERRCTERLFPLSNEPALLQPGYVTKNEANIVDARTNKAPQSRSTISIPMSNRQKIQEPVEEEVIETKVHPIQNRPKEALESIYRSLQEPTSMGSRIKQEFGIHRVTQIQITNEEQTIRAIYKSDSDELTLDLTDLDASSVETCQKVDKNREPDEIQFSEINNLPCRHLVPASRERSVQLKRTCSMEGGRVQKARKVAYYPNCRQEPRNRKHRVRRHCQLTVKSTSSALSWATEREIAQEYVAEHVASET